MEGMERLRHILWKADFKTHSEKGRDMICVDGLNLDPWA